MDDLFLKMLMEHRSMLHSFIYGLVRDPHYAEDVLQETVVVLWAKYSQFEKGTNFGAWARFVAYREVLTHRRSEWRAHRHLDEQHVERLLSAYERRQATVDVTEHRAALQSCLEKLKKDIRRVMEWRFMERWSSKQIAAKLKRTAQAVDTMVYRTKATLAECIRRRLARTAE